MTDTSGYYPSPDYGQMRQTAATAWQNTMAQLNQQRRNLLDQSGFNYTLNPNGTLQIGQLDPTKQFGAIQQMMQGQGQEIQQNNALQSQRGLGQYGMAAQRDRLIRLAHQTQMNQQAQGLQQQLGDFNVAQQGGQADYNNQLASIASQQGQYNAGLAQYQAQTAASQQAQQTQQNFVQQLLAMLQGGGA